MCHGLARSQNYVIWKHLRHNGIGALRTLKAKDLFFLEKGQNTTHETIWTIQMQTFSTFQSFFKNQHFENPPSAGMKLSNLQIYLKSKLVYDFS